MKEMQSNSVRVGNFDEYDPFKYLSFSHVINVTVQYMGHIL